MEELDNPKRGRGSSLKENKGCISITNKDSSITKLPKLKLFMNNQVNDYNSRLSNLQKAISVNSSQNSLVENKQLNRPKQSSILDKWVNDDIHSAYTNRSKNTDQNKSLKSLASIDLLKKYYKNKRNNHSHIKNSASIELYDRYNGSRLQSKNSTALKSNNNLSYAKLGNSFANR